MAANSGDILVANETGMIIVDGERYMIHKGVTRVRKGHPMIKGNEALFKPIDVHYDVEQATRAPGEKRGGHRRAPKKAAAAKTAPAAPAKPVEPPKGDDD